MKKPDKIQFQISASTNKDRYFMHLSPKKIFQDNYEDVGSF
jgi:hypothetical protein